MIIPLLAGYILFAWISDHNKNLVVEEQLQAQILVHNMQGLLDDEKWFRANTYNEIIEAVKDNEIITFYNESGKVLFSTNEQVIEQLAEKRNFFSSKPLYENLYKIERDYNYYTYRAPVFHNKEIIGFYEVKLVRTAWQQGVKNRTWTVIALFIAIFTLAYGGIVMVMNRKFTYRLQQLMQQMQCYAKGEPVIYHTPQHDEIGELTASFYAMQQELSAAKDKLAQEQAKKEWMIASISHDLKTPLTAIRAYAESMTLQSEQTQDKHKAYSQIIMDKASFMQQMLDDLTVYTTMQSPQYTMNFVTVDGEEFFEMLADDYQQLAQQKALHLTHTCMVTGQYAVNPKQLMRVMDNIMSNAFMHAASMVNVAIINAKAENHTPLADLQPYLNKQTGVYIIVQNDGEIIAQEALPYVFDPLYQVDTARTKTGERGTGLGLSITKQIIEKHGGEVQVVSNKKIGTAIICWLPQDREGEKML